MTPTARTESNDSGLGIDEALTRGASVVNVDDTVTAAAGRPSSVNNDVFLAPATNTAAAAGSDAYVSWEDAMSHGTTSTTSTLLTPVMTPTGYVIAWTDNDDRGLVFVSDQDAYSDHHDSEEASVSAASEHAVNTSHCEDDCPSTLAADSEALDTTQPQNNDRETRRQDTVNVDYITLEQLQGSPSNGVPDDSLRSINSVV